MILASIAFFLLGLMALVAGMLALIYRTKLTSFWKTHYGRIYGDGFAKLMSVTSTSVLGGAFVLGGIYGLVVGIYFLGK